MKLLHYYIIITSTQKVGEILRNYEYTKKIIRKHKRVSERDKQKKTICNEN